MRDMKYEMHCIAEEIAQRKYGKDFYDLSEAQQSEVWGEAEEEWNDRQQDKAERMLDDLKCTPGYKESGFILVKRR